MRKTAPPSFAALVQEFFTNYLVDQRALSPQTVGSYRDAFMLLLDFAEKRLGKPPTVLQLADITSDLLASFLDHLERDRGNSVRTRNARLAAVRSFLKLAARRDLTSLRYIEEALAVPMKRFDRPMMGFLTREEVFAVMDAPPRTWVGERDRLLLVLAETSFVHLRGKGRKQRSVPLWKTTVKSIRTWLKRNGQPAPDRPLFPTRAGHPMTRANASQRLQRALKTAIDVCPRLAARPISPHTIRHTTAMHLLQSGVDISVIALWLGHESPSTTHGYIELDLAMKEKALARLEAPDIAVVTRYRPPDDLLRFLQTL